MSDIQDEFFGTLEVDDAELNEKGNVKVSRINLDRYRPILAQVPVGKTGSVTVPTGDIIPNERMDKDGNPVIDEETGRPVMNPNRGRGKTELEAFRAMRTIADLDYGMGIDIRFQHLPNGRTQLRFAMHPKREFTPEQNIAREAARKVGLLRRAEKTLATKVAALKRQPNDVKRQEAVKKAQATLVRLKAEQAAEAEPNGEQPSAPAKQPAKATTATK